MEFQIAQYERDDRSDSFRMLGGVIATIAENHGIEIDETTRVRWSELLGLLREFDTFVDDQQVPEDDALLELFHFGRFKDNYPNLGPPEVAQEVHLKMVRRVALILEHGRHLRYTTDPRDFLHHRSEEVDHTAELLADCATGDVLTQAGFYTRFMPTLRTMGRAANFIDTLTDFRKDKQEEKVSIKGTPAFYRLIGASAISEFVHASHIFADPRVLKQFYAMSAMRLKNRLEHGKRPYSSLKNIH